MSPAPDARAHSHGRRRPPAPTGPRARRPRLLAALRRPAGLDSTAAGPRAGLTTDHPRAVPGLRRAAAFEPARGGGR